jgi:hypothetical protein
MKKKKVGDKTDGHKHSAFRRTKEWKNFRKEFLKRFPIDPFTGQKAMVIHHRRFNEKNFNYYDLRNFDDFIGLNRSFHLLLHRLNMMHDKANMSEEMKSILKQFDTCYFECDFETPQANE